MPQSLVKLLVHIVFSTKHRREMITPDIENRLFAYISGIVENNNSKLILANGTPDHVHLLVSLGKTLAISELVGDVKRSSSAWIKKEDKRFSQFYWQEGYGAFSIGQSQVDDVLNYIRNQKTHHEKTDFKSEYRSFMDKYELEYDERYCWD